MTTERCAFARSGLIGDPDEGNRRQLQKAIGKTLQKQLENPKVMFSVMNLITRGLPEGDRP